MHARIQSLIDALAPLAQPQKAAEMAAYMRHQFCFLGIPTPARRLATRPFLKQPLPADDLLATAQALWALPEREYQYVAVDWLARQWRQLGPEHLPALLTLVQQKSWWDTVDGLAGAIGDLLKREKATNPQAQAPMDAALHHPNFWVRRIALLHQLGWKADTDEDRLFNEALTLGHESEFFIRKAIGWALRDYARHRPEAVRAFLQTHGHRLSGLSVREAAKHL